MKRILLIAIALMMVFALAACGEDTGKTPSGSEGSTPPSSQQTDPGTSAPDNQGGSEQTNTPNPSGDNTSPEAPWFGWTEDDMKPDTGFASIEDMNGQGWSISLTEPLTEDTYKAWYAKLISKIEGFADNGKYTIPNVPDLEEGLSQAVQVFNAGGGALYIMFEYEVGDMKIGVTTGVTNFKDTKDVLYVYLREIE